QKHARESERYERGVALSIAVFLIARNRIARVLSVHANLMRATGPDLDVEQRRELAERLHRFERAERVLTVRVHAHHPLSALLLIGLQRQIDALGAEWPAATHEREVVLVHLAFAEQGMQLAEHRPTLRDQQAAARLAIEPVHELELREIRSRC